MCHKIPNFIEKATRAGAGRVFIGLENINPDNLIAAKKRQNKITEYRAMMQKWRDHGALTCAGYILGFPADTKESILRDVEIIKRELPLDLLEFFFLTPLPGSEDHKHLLAKGVWMDPDLNKYDLNHRVSQHGKMSDSEWEEAYRAAWASYYSLDHIRTILRRAGVNRFAILEVAAFDPALVPPDDRLREPASAGRRRVAAQVPQGPPPGLPIESAFVFYPRMVRESLRKLSSYGHPAVPDHHEGGPRRARPGELHRRGHHPAGDPGVRRTVALSRNDRGAKPRSLASGATRRTATSAGGDGPRWRWADSGAGGCHFSCHRVSNVA